MHCGSVLLLLLCMLLLREQQQLLLLCMCETQFLLDLTCSQADIKGASMQYCCTPPERVREIENGNECLRF